MLQPLGSHQLGNFSCKSFRVSLHNFILGHLDQVRAAFVVATFFAPAVRSARLSTCEALTVQFQALWLRASAFFHFFFIGIWGLRYKGRDCCWFVLGKGLGFALGEFVEKSLRFFVSFNDSFVSGVAGGILLFFDLNGFFLTALQFLSYR